MDLEKYNKAITAVNANNMINYPKLKKPISGGMHSSKFLRPSFSLINGYTDGGTKGAAFSLNSAGDSFSELDIITLSLPEILIRQNIKIDLIPEQEDSMIDFFAAIMNQIIEQYENKYNKFNDIYYCTHYGFELPGAKNIYVRRVIKSIDEKTMKAENDDTLIELRFYINGTLESNVLKNE